MGFDNNFFQYRKKTYKQIKGTAMGSNVAPAFANLYLIFDELSLRENSKDNLFPKLYMRYIDDIFFIWDKTISELLQFKKSLIETTSLNITFDTNSSEVVFLDLRIFKGISLDLPILWIGNYTKKVLIYIYILLQLVMFQLTINFVDYRRKH